MRVYVSFNLKNVRQNQLINAVKSGIRQMGWTVVPLKKEADLMIVWGMTVEHRVMLKQAAENSVPTLMMDLPYWNRRGRRWATESDYKISLNGVHPTRYLDAGAGPKGRYHKIGGMIIADWKKRGSYILLAGLGPKGSRLYNFDHGQWDKEAVSIIKSVTDRPIIYRPKPSDKRPPEISGVSYDNVEGKIFSHFNHAHAIVTHHGNATIEGMQFGVPGFCKRGPASLIANTDLLNIENPVYSPARQDFFEKLAYWQWSYKEILEGKPFMHLTNKGLING